MTRQALVIVALLAGTGVAFAGLRGHEGPRGPRGPRMMGAMREKLGLSEAQVEQMRKLTTEHKKAHIRQRADLEIARLELKGLLDATTLDEKAIAAKAKQLGDLEAAAIKARVDAHVAMRQVLTPEQQQKFRDMRPLGPAGRHGDGPPRRPRGDARRGDAGDLDGEEGGREGGPDEGPDALTAAEGE